MNMCVCVYVCVCVCMSVCICDSGAVKRWYKTWLGANSVKMDHLNISEK